jgi:hypothetical protein
MNRKIMDCEKWSKDLKYVNTQLLKKKENGNYNLYLLISAIYNDCPYECFSYFYDHIEKMAYTEDELVRIKNSFPEWLKPKKETKEPPRDWVMVKNYLSVSKNPGSVAELKKFAEEQGIDYNVFRQWVRKHKPDLQLESLRAPRVVTDSGKAEALKLLQSGLTITKVKEKTGIPVAILNGIADENGIHRIRRNRKKTEAPDLSNEVVDEVVNEVPEITEPVKDVPEVRKSQVMNPIQGFFTKRNSEPEVLTGEVALRKLEAFFEGREPSRQILNDVPGYAKRIAKELNVSVNQATKFLKHLYSQFNFEGAIRNTEKLISECNLWIAQRLFQTEKLIDFKYEEVKALKEKLDFLVEIKDHLESAKFEDQ